MTSRLEQIMLQAGPPAIANLYNRDRWRYAIYHARGVADGYLDIPPTASAQDARTALEAMLQDICQRFYHCIPAVQWEPPDAQGMIAGSIQIAPLPPPPV